MAAMYLIFVYINPDRLIIKYNIAHTAELKQEDIDFFCKELESKVVMPEIENMRVKFAPDEEEGIETILTKYQEGIVRNVEGMSLRETNFAKKSAYNKAKATVGEAKKLAKYELTHDEETYDEKVYYEGKTYYQFGYSQGDVKGIEIGYINDEKKVYSVKGRNPQEWIYSYEEWAMGSGVGYLYKTKDADTPDELELFRAYSYEE